MLIDLLCHTGKELEVAYHGRLPKLSRDGVLEVVHRHVRAFLVALLRRGELCRCVLRNAVLVRSSKVVDNADGDVRRCFEHILHEVVSGSTIANILCRVVTGHAVTG